MSKPIKAGKMDCANWLFERQELNENIAEWQQQDEEQNLEVINRHELQEASEAEAAAHFTQEINKRKSNDQQD